MGFFKFMDNHKSVISAMIAIVLLVVVSVGFYKFYSDDTLTLEKSYTIGNVTEFNDTVTIKQGQTISQRYQIDAFDYNQLGFMAVATTEDAVLDVKISNGKSTQANTFTQNELVGEYVYINLNENLKNAGKTDLTVEFTATTGSFDFSLNNSVVIENSECTLDAKALQSNVVIDLRTLSTGKINYEFLFIAIAMVVFLTALLVVIKFKCFKIEAITAFVLLFFCVICMFIFEPFTVPDEATHYRSAYHVSNLMTFDFSDKDNGLQMRRSDYEFFVNGHHSVYDQSYIHEGNYDKFFVERNQKIDTDYGFIATKKALPYVASGLGITVAKIFSIGPYWTFQIARLFNSIMAIMLIYFAIKILPYGKIALSVISLIPINLHILASCSYDAFTYGSIVFMFSYIMKIMHDEQKIDWKQILALAAIIFIVIPQKVVYIGVAAILLIIPKDRFKNPKWHFVIKCMLGIIAVTSILILQMGDAAKLADSSAYSNEVAGYSINYILQNPIQIAIMLCKTIIVQSDFYIKSLISFFAWFEFETPWFMAIPYVVMILFACMRIKGEPRALGYTQRMYSLAMLAVVFLVVEMLLLLDHTTFGSEIVLGVQGRYFIPALPLLMLFVRNNTVELAKSFEKKMLYAISVFNCGVFIYCASNIV